MLPMKAFQRLKAAEQKRDTLIHAAQLIYQDTIQQIFNETELVDTDDTGLELYPDIEINARRLPIGRYIVIQKKRIHEFFSSIFT